LFQAEPLDEVSLKKLLLQFEKRLYRNQELRIKFPDMPEKYAVLAVINFFLFILLLGVTFHFQVLVFLSLCSPPVT